MYCVKCGTEVSFFYQEMGVDANNQKIYAKFQSCRTCNILTQVPLDYGVQQNTQPQEQVKKESTLSIIASSFCIVALIIPLPIVLLFLINLTYVILAIIDISMNDKTKKHSGSWVSLILGIIVIIAGLLFGYWGLTSIGVAIS